MQKPAASSKGEALETNKHPHPTEPPNEENKVTEPAVETVELNATGEEPAKEGGVVGRPAIRLAPGSGASTHPTG